MKTIKIPLRNTSANDSLCEIFKNNDCTNCNGCDTDHFEINIFDDFFTISYHKKIDDLVIERYSERIDMNLIRPS